MKKILSIFLVLVTMLAMCMSLVACGLKKPNLDFEDAAKNLERKGYNVVLIYEDGYGSHIGYAIKNYISASEEDGDNYIYIYEFKTAKAARLYYNFIKMDYGKGSAIYKFYKRLLRKYGDDMEREDRKDLEDYIEEMEEEVCGRSGKYVWYGTKDAAKDTKR